MHDHTHFAHRESSGLVVDLYWDPTDALHEFRVEVAERDGGDRFVLFPATGRAAVQAFHHPFAPGLSTSAGVAAALFTTNPEVHQS